MEGTEPESITPETEAGADAVVDSDLKGKSLPQEGKSLPQEGTSLPFLSKVFFGMPAFGRSAMEMPISVHLPRLYSDVILAPLGFIAVAIAMARALDAITDPAMGWISDRTRTRWGRRLPWIALGVPLSAITYWFLWAPPEDFSPTQASVWFCVAFMLYYICSTTYQIPQEALGAELSLEYHERSTLFSIQAVFGFTGLMVAAVLPYALQRSGLELRAAYQAMGLIYAILIVVLFIPFLLRVRERPEFATRASNPLVPGVRRAFRNKPFRILLITGIVSAIPAGIPSIMMPYLTYYVLRPDEPERWLMLNLLAMLGSGFLFLPFWVVVARRIGKLPTRVVGALISISGFVMLFTVGEGDMLKAWFIYVYLGSPFGGRSFLLPSMHADVIDYDELRTGMRREGQFAAFWAIMPKLVAVPSLSVPLAILGAAGYVPNQPQTEEVVFTIRFLTSLFPMAFFITAVVIILRYPISEKIHLAIRKGVAAHARGEDAIDPLTNEVLPPPAKVSAEEEEMSWRLNYFSFRELRHLLRDGPGRIVRDVWTVVAVSLVAFISLVVLATLSVSDLQTKPGFISVFWIVSAGFSLTAFLFHALRVGPARQMVSEPVPAKVVEDHLKNWR